MFAVSAIRDAFNTSGELSAAVELRRLIPGVPMDRARQCAMQIAGWQPIPDAPALPANVVPGLRRRTMP
jgi:hypothetical protein